MITKIPYILVVDDNPENIRVLGAVLAQSNYKIAIATNGEIALEMVEKNPPDLILLDVMMPGMDGFQVCERLKNNPKTKDIEIIFVTAAISQEDELKGLALGAVDYIHKPFSTPIVQAKVALHLERIANKKLREDIEQLTRHDLKTPLNAVLGYPQMMLLDDSLSTEHREYLEEILSAGQQMLHLVNHSLDLFKMEKGIYQYAPRPLDMALVIQRVVKDLQTVIQEHTVNINMLLEGQEYNGEQSFLVLAEMSLTYSLFANLIRNAIEACSANDTITIAICYENNQVVVAITNPGTVPAEIRATFFDKYATAGKFGGTGLGTYSAKLMTVTQNGTIAMTTNEQETCLTVKLPAA
jgi:CheY-like chemotaxis protein